MKCRVHQKYIENMYSPSQKNGSLYKFDLENCNEDNINADTKQWTASIMINNLFYSLIYEFKVFLLSLIRFVLNT